MRQANRRSESVGFAARQVQDGYVLGIDQVLRNAPLLSQFVVLGMPKAAFGLAWPSIAVQLDREIADLGIAIAVFTTAYVLASVSSGRLVGVAGIRSVVVLGAWIAAVSLGGYAATTTWATLLASAAGFGIAAGFIDAGINAHTALREGAGAMGYLHAAFGLGATLGPLALTVLLGNDLTWRAGFVAFALLQGFLALWLSFGHFAWVDAKSAQSAPAKASTVPPFVVGGLLGVFFLYAATEVAAGQWAFSALSEERGLSDSQAGLAVTSYWASLTASRFLLGVAGDRVRPVWASFASMTLALAGFLIAWLADGAGGSLVGLALAGFGLGPIFPIMVSLTPRWVGIANTPTMVGYEIGVANAGAIVVPGGMGLLVAGVGLGVVAPVLASSALALLVANAALHRVAPLPEEVASG